MAVKIIELPEVLEFDWDEGNIEKNKSKHHVEPEEAEAIFYNKHVFFYDEKHSQTEDRYLIYGETNEGRLLAAVFTVRRKKVRVVSVRDQNKKERKVYETNT